MLFWPKHTSSVNAFLCLTPKFIWVKELLHWWLPSVLPGRGLAPITLETSPLIVGFLKVESKQRQMALFSQYPCLMQSQIFVWRKQSVRQMGPHPEVDYRTDYQRSQHLHQLSWRFHRNLVLLTFMQEPSPATLPDVALWAIKAYSGHFVFNILAIKVQTPVWTGVMYPHIPWSTSFSSNPTHSTTFPPLKVLVCPSEV